MYFFCSSGIECIRYNKSTDELFAVENNNEPWGQTSNSFVFDGNTVQNKPKITIHQVNTKSKDVHKEDISYRAFSSFDDIALADHQDQNQDNVSDSGLGSLGSLNSNYLKLKPLQTMTDLADLGIQNWRSNFTLANLRRR